MDLQFHMQRQNMQKKQLYFCKMQNQLDWGTLDDTKVNYAFALIVPKKQQEMNI